MATNVKPATSIKPFVVLKPCANETPNGIYSVRGNMYLPEEDSLGTLIAFLNAWELGDLVNKDSVDSKIPEILPVRKKPVTLESVTALAHRLNCTVLGATFLEFIKSFGIGLGGSVSQFRVDVTDIVFFKSVYPIFEGYFANPRTSDPALDDYLAGVVVNNTGNYMSVTVDGDVPAHLMSQIAYLKRFFRYAVKLQIPYEEKAVRDNLVHSPENMEELVLHARLFTERSL